MNVTLANILAASKRIDGLAIRAPLVPSPHMTDKAGSEVLLKLETTQPIGAFKLRGAANAILALPPDTAGVTCCSTGNHGRGVAYAARHRGIRAVIFMSSLVPQTKIDGIRALGAEVRIVGDSQDDALAASQWLAAAENLTEISPWN
jgi:threonine dehydratase